jgi:hypothetical protein
MSPVKEDGPAVEPWPNSRDREQVRLAAHRSCEQSENLFGHFDQRHLCANPLSGTTTNTKRIEGSVRSDDKPKTLQDVIST